MKAGDILNEWTADAAIDKTALDDAALRIPVLHAKYLRLYFYQRMMLKEAQADLAVLRGRKRAWYSGEMTQDELQAAGWQQFQGIVLKAQLDGVLATDEDLVHAQLKVDALQEKVAMLDQIMKMLLNRSYQISGAVNFMKMQNGIG